MTDNQKIAEWLGYEVRRLFNGVLACGKDGHLHIVPVPDYPNDPAAALGLLGVLSGKGYKVDLQSDGPKYWSVVLHHPDMKQAICSLHDSPSAAIVAAVLQLIEGESA